MTGERHDSAPSQAQEDGSELSASRLIGLAGDPMLPEAARQFAGSLTEQYLHLGPPPAELLPPEQAPVETPPVVES